MIMLKRTTKLMNESDVTSSPRINPGASPPHDGAFLLRWKLPLKRQVACLVLHCLHRHWLSASPAVASQSWSTAETWFLFLDRRKREYDVQHGHVFTPSPSLGNSPKRSSVLKVLEQVYYKEHEMSSETARGASSPLRSSPYKSIRKWTD